MPKKTRHRQLAKQAVRRQAEKRQKRRARRVTTGLVAGAVGVAGLVIVFVAFRGGGTERATGTPTPSATSSPTPSESPGTQIGTVNPSPAPKSTACGGVAPKGGERAKPQFSAPAQVLKDEKTSTATIETSCGTIVVELLTKDAPVTANSFAFLAEQGFYDGLRFHRLDTSIDVIQGGDPVGDGSSGPGYQTPDELSGKESYGPGVVAMANSGPNTDGSQFFIVSGNKGHLLDDQGLWTIFGTVTEGMDVVKKIQELRVADPKAAALGPGPGQQPADAVYIEKITIAEG